jgi:hypothetical protein
LETLEDEARIIAFRRRRPRHANGDPLMLGLEREIAFTLSQMDQMRSLRADLKRDLLQTECYVETELMQMEARTPRYSSYRFPEREKFQRRLAEIGAERRRLEAIHEDKMQILRRQLFTLMQRFALIQMPPPSDKTGRYEKSDPLH